MRLLPIRKTKEMLNLSGQVLGNMILKMKLKTLSKLQYGKGLILRLFYFFSYFFFWILGAKIKYSVIFLFLFQQRGVSENSTSEYDELEVKSFTSHTRWLGNDKIKSWTIARKCFPCLQSKSIKNPATARTPTARICSTVDSADLQSVPTTI